MKGMYQVVMLPNLDGSSQSRLQDKAKKLLDIQSTVWQGVDKLFQSARCMVTFLSNSQF